jgi:hypothetical protein
MFDTFSECMISIPSGGAGYGSFNVKLSVAKPCLRQIYFYTSLGNGVRAVTSARSASM